MEIEYSKLYMLIKNGINAFYVGDNCALVLASCKRLNFIKVERSKEIVLKKL